jgi:hypothetical protein
VTAVLPPPSPETYVQAPAPPSGPGAPPPKRNMLPFAIAGTVLVVIAAIVAVIVSAGGGGGGNKPTPTVAADTTTTATTAGGDEKAKADIQLALSTTLKAARAHNKLVFCGGLSLRYQTATWGGAIECQDAAAQGNIPAQFTSASDAASSTTINGNRAAVITVDGNTFQFVKGASFWMIDGVG